MSREKKWNIKVAVILILVRAFGTISKKLEKRSEELKNSERMEIIQTTVLSKSIRILEDMSILTVTQTLIINSHLDLV